MKPFPPLGLLYLSSHLKARGFAVVVHDTTFSSAAELVDRIAAERPAVVGLYCNLMTKAAILELIPRCKELGCWVVLGGPEPAPNAAEYLAHGADVVVAGEGEATLEELLEHLPKHGRDGLAGIAGIAFRDPSGKVVRSSPRALLQPLSAQPWPDRAAIDLEAYLSTWQRHHGQRTASLISSRGCPYTCTWCSHGVFGASHRRRDPDDVAAEVAFLAERYGATRLWYADDVFTLNRPWTVRLAAALAERSLHLPFECISRADRLDEEVVDTLAAMGCARLWLGAESGSQRLLDRMGRRTTVADVRAKTALLKSRGIEVGMFIMLGYDGEDEEDLAATVELLVAADPELFLTTVAYPIRGTGYWDAVADRIVSDRPWSARSDRDLAVADRPSRRYYRHATRWLSNRARLGQALAAGRLAPLDLARWAAGAAAGRLGMHLSRQERDGAGGSPVLPAGHVGGAR
jgi:radical SAM superfamily enzyme YgiQ (UPF0313 family)